MAQVQSNIAVPIGSGNAVTVFSCPADGPPARRITIERSESAAGTANIFVVINGFSDDREYTLFGSSPASIVFSGEGSSGPRGQIRDVAVYADASGETINFAVTSV
jgi:hypothetical protein